MPNHASPKPGPSVRDTAKLTAIEFTAEYATPAPSTAGIVYWNSLTDGCPPKKTYTAPPRPTARTSFAVLKATLIQGFLRTSASTTNTVSPTTDIASAGGNRNAAPTYGMKAIEINELPTETLIELNSAASPTARIAMRPLRSFGEACQSWPWQASTRAKAAPVPTQNT